MTVDWGGSGDGRGARTRTVGSRGPNSGRTKVWHPGGEEIRQGQDQGVCPGDEGGAEGEESMFTDSKLRRVDLHNP